MLTKLADELPAGDYRFTARYSAVKPNQHHTGFASPPEGRSINA
jgi:hypothetical protein